MKKPTEINEAAKILSQQGAKKGGQARANVLTEEQRRQIAREAVRARWMKAGRLKQTDGEMPSKPAIAQEINTTPEQPFSLFQGSLTMGDIVLECHVLNDGRRVSTQRAIVRAISGGRESGDLGVYIESNPLANKDLFADATVRFKIPGVPTPANGFEATSLIELCDLYLQAREQGLLKHNQLKLAVQAEIILRSCAKVGIIALIDEATGYQQVRAKNALQLKLQAFIADDLQEWALMFPHEFWIELARLEGIRYSPRSRPLRWGKYIMAFVYDAIDKDVGKELREKNPNPQFKRNHHQWLKEFGQDKVREQITKVVTIMKLCGDMNDFRSKFAKVFRNQPLQMTLQDIDWSIAPDGSGS